MIAKVAGGCYIPEAVVCGVQRPASAPRPSWVGSARHATWPQTQPCTLWGLDPPRQGIQGQSGHELPLRRPIYITARRLVEQSSKPLPPHEGNTHEGHLAWCNAGKMVCAVLMCNRFVVQITYPLANKTKHVSFVKVGIYF